MNNDNTTSKRKRNAEPIRTVTLKNGDTRYRLIVDAGTKADGTRRQVCKTFRTKKEAQDALHQIKTEVRSGAYVAKTRTTVEAYLTEWLASQMHLEATTRAGYEAIIQPVIAAYGSLPLQAVTKQHVVRLVKERATTGGRTGDGVSPRTNQFMLTVWGAAMKAAVAEQLIAVNPVTGVKPPKNTNGKTSREPWTGEQARVFLAHVADDRYAVAYRLALYGLRRGEVLGLRWSRVDFDASQIVVDTTRVVAGSQTIVKGTKTDEPRTVPVGPEVIADLRVMQLRQQMEAAELGDGYNPDDLVVVNEAGRPIRPETYGWWFQKHAAAAGLPRIRLHQLRAVTASLLVNDGVPLVIVASLLGHDVETLISHYATAYERERFDAMARLSGMYAAAV